jgi:hypothetical protein
MICVNPAAAFNRDWQREDILNAGFEKLFDLSTTALILDQALSNRHAQLSPPEPPHGPARNGNGTGADMRSVFSLATFAIGVLFFVAFLTKVRPVSIIAAPSPSEQVRVQ